MSHSTQDAAVQAAYRAAHDRYAEIGVDTDAALDTLRQIPLSLHCWQGDDVSGFESAGLGLDGGIAATGNYPGKARSAQELRQDLDVVYRLIPGTHRLNLHAIYAETDGQHVERNELQPVHFAGWADWARANGHGLDFNPTLFSHPRAAAGFTLASADDGIRRFWVEHCIASRRIGEYFGRELGTPCVTNIWIPDGFKDTPVDRWGPRERLRTALDQVLAEKVDSRYNRDAVEGKLFGLGSESYVVGSHEFYLGYAISRHILLCLDSGHFHPTETVSDKLSAVMLYVDELLLHVSRGVRWDSDHVVTFSDELQAIAQELVRGRLWPRTHIGLDYFDASINRLAAWVIGARNTLRALLAALLEPLELLREAERTGDWAQRLALLEELKALPFGAVWDYNCLKQDVPISWSYMDQVHRYEADVLARRT